LDIEVGQGCVVHIELVDAPIKGHCVATPRGVVLAERKSIISIVPESSARESGV
jgi:hypothetical protein